jgi:hypothetical protein
MDKLLRPSISSKRKNNPELYYFFLFVLVCIIFLFFSFFISPTAQARAAEESKTYSNAFSLPSNFEAKSKTLSFLPIPITVVTSQGETKYLSYIGSYRVGDIINELKIDTTNYKVIPPLDELLFYPYVITMVKQEIKLTTSERVLPYDTEVIETNEMYQGQEEELQSGKDGKQIITYKEYYEDGVFTNKEAINTSITSQPVTRIVKLGTKIYFDNLGNSSVQYWADVIDTVDATESEKYWLKQVMKCESMGRADVVAANSYYGLYQYDYNTWTTNCNESFDNVLDGNKQINCTLKLYRAGHENKWPVCSK